MSENGTLQLENFIIRYNDTSITISSVSGLWSMTANIGSEVFETLTFLIKAKSLHLYLEQYIRFNFISYNNISFDIEFMEDFIDAYERNIIRATDDYISQGLSKNVH